MEPGKERERERPLFLNRGFALGRKHCTATDQTATPLRPLDREKT